jgi:hypothetical protein
MSEISENKGFQPEPANHGFQPPSDNQHSQPQPAGGFSQGGFQQTLNMDDMMAFARGSAAGVPIGYDHGLAHAAAKSSSSSAPGMISLGFIDTNETKTYGDGYQYGWAQGFGLGYAQGLTQSASGGFSQGGFSGGFSQGGFSGNDA